MRDRLDVIVVSVVLHTNPKVMTHREVRSARLLARLYHRLGLLLEDTLHHFAVHGDRDGLLHTHRLNTDNLRIGDT